MSERDDEGDLAARVAALEARLRERDARLLEATRELERQRRERARVEASVAELLTHVERMAEELARGRDDALAAARAKTTFLATMSHEIRTPMNAILGMAGILDESELTAEQHEWTETIRMAGNHLLTVINDILDFSKLSSGKVPFERLPFDPAQVLDEALELIAPLARARSVELARDVAPGAAKTLLGDASRIRQVLLNYLSNAVKFTERGRVTIHLDAKEVAGRVELHYAVRDTGPGMTEAQIPRLFQSFTQLDDSTHRRFGGTGLGLAICKSLAERMGGRVWAESTPGVGSTFHATLLADPAPPGTATRAEPSQTTPRPTDAANATALRVLVAEDNAVNLKILLTMLKRLGYEPGVASNGREVLEALRAAPYDVILMDVQMPEVDGREATRAIHAEWPREKWPRVIALTAGVTEEERADCLAAGMDDFLTKPISRDELQRALVRAAALMPPRGARDEPRA